MDDKEKLSAAYNGLSYLIGDFFNEENISFEFNKYQKASGVENPLVLQAIFAVSEIRKHLRRFPNVIFCRESLVSTSIKGRVSFVKTLRKFNGLIHKSVNETNVISEQSLERMFLAQALPIIQGKVGSRVGTESQTQLVSIFDECKFHLSSVVLKNIDVFQLSLKIIHKQGNRTGDSAILPFCKILAQFLLSEFFLQSDKNSNHHLSGFDFLLNLNRPFEVMLRNLIRKKIPLKTSHKDNFSKLQFSESEKSALNMRPDIWTVDENETLFIFDAKHKIFDSDFESSNSSNGMKREDLYQLISYIRTNRINQNEGVFGLIGLTDEKSNQNVVEPLKYFENLESVYFELKEDGKAFKKIEILFITSRFGSILYEFGSRLSSPEKLNQFWDQLSDELYLAINRGSLKTEEKVA